jgi:precorrin-8X/cobalt-precorrin-8 methylmutase
VASFDRYVIVDWSAAGRPRVGPDSVWIASLGSRGVAATRNPPTRGAAALELGDELVDATRRAERVLVGFDFPLAFPRGLATALGGDGTSWNAVSEYLETSLRDDDATNGNTRFEVAAAINARLGHHVFWGCPPRRAGRDLSARKGRVQYRADERTGPTDGQTAGLAEWREVERLLRKVGFHPHSAWQLLGAGSVGGQALTGIPVVRRLRRHPALAETSRVWPFEVLEPRLRERMPAVIHAEVWPSLVPLHVPDHEVKDRVQVIRLAERLRELDRADLLLRIFAAAPPGSEEEGWILGVGPDGSNLLAAAGAPRTPSRG